MATDLGVAGGVGEVVAADPAVSPAFLGTFVGGWEGEGCES